MGSMLRTPEFKVGMLVVIVASLIAGMSLKVSESSGFMGGKNYWFAIENAAGLIKNGPVHVAGIRVGVVKKISLNPDGQARVDVVIQQGVQLSKSSKIQIRPNGILGDKHIEIIPGLPSDAMLAEGDQIMGVDDAASLDKLIGDAGRVAKSLVVVADNLRDATEGDDSKPVGKILKNLETLSGDLKELVASKKGEVGEMITAMKSAMIRIDRAMVNVEQISEKINEGKGTIGRLINDEELIDQLDTTLTTFGNLSDLANKTEVSIEGHSNYLSRAESTRTYLGVNIRPGTDRFYEVGLVSKPGGETQKTTRTTVTNGVPTTIVDTAVEENKYRLTLMLGKNFYNFGVKAGIIEGEGGVGVDYTFWRDKVKVGVDAFDFAPDKELNRSFQLRPYARYNIIKGVYLQGGGEDLLNERTRSVFFGGGVFLTNEDLKAFINRVNVN
ncbi:MAG: MCE family protein [Bdellovibrionaceae bacterium]|nr:MCE family protein [Pseudobdellovibrionaceae bacterium]